MLISVVITTKNEEKNIENCIVSIKNQNLRNLIIEIIVIDNFSNDKTIAIAQKHNTKTYTYGPERNAQRNFGLLKIAKGKLLLWIDADMILHPDLIYEASKLLINDDNAVGVTFPEIILGRSLFSKVRRFERSFYDNTPIDGSRLIKASAFKTVGGFSNTWLHGPDDWDLDMELRQVGNIIHLNKQGGKIKFEKFLKNKFNLNINKYPIGIYHNESELGLINHLKKKAHYSKDFELYIEKWGKNNKIIKMQVGIFYRFFQVFVENKKWIKTIKNPHMYFLFFLTKFTTGLIYMFQKYKNEKN